MSAPISPFKFLDPFTIDDRETFFGRDMEIDTLYELAFETSLILVYGPSGAGKTSLIQCGLASRFEDTDWFALPIRRKTNINDSIRQEISKYAITPLDENAPVLEAVHSLYLDYFKPIYLIFDQFEELYILGSEQERTTFIRDLKTLLQADFPRKVVIIMREEYIAQLYDFEKIVPELFDHRVRVEPMNVANVERVIRGSAQQFQIQLDPETETISAIIDNVSHGKSGVQLPYLQVYLDRLYLEAVNGSEFVTFEPGLISKVGDIGEVLGDFLEQQTLAIQEELIVKFPDAPDRAVKKILGAFVTLEGTKKPIPQHVISIAQFSPEQLDFCLDKLEKARILRLEDGIYELAHDTLAVQISNDRSGDEIAFLETVKLVKDRFYAFDRTNTLLNRNELLLTQAHKKRAEQEDSFNEAEWAFIKKSSRSIRRRRLGLGLIVLTIIAVLAVFSIFSFQQRQTALTLQEEAETNLKQLAEEQAQREEAKYNEHLARGKAWMVQNDFNQAIQEFNTALAFKENGQEADSLKLISETKEGLKERFDQLIASGDAFYNEGPDTYVDALNQYKQALQLGFDNNEAQNKIDALNAKLEGAFENFRKKGDTFYQAEACDYALLFYRKALRIRPADRQLQDRVKECENKS